MNFVFRNITILLIFIFVACQNESAYFSPEITNELPEQVDYNFHIQPIIADRCFKCHGPDTKTRKAGLRFDTQEGLFSTTVSGKKLIKPGKPAASAIIEHILSDAPDIQMPPPDSKLSLSDYEKALIYKWIKQGAKWKKHWAFIPPQQPKIPQPHNKQWAKNPIDHFILSRLEKEGIKPSPEADKERLLRRVYLDLTGLPPSPAQTDAFLNDSSPQAYEKVVDSLLGSISCAERLTMEWLDVARYADSHGYHADGWRSMYPWRDWVIKAFHENMPYDKFVSWQIAGDLMPNATEEQILATGFNRNHQISAEGGIIDEEYRLEYVADRATTTATAFLGMTMKCAQCHDHKFDPISQKEFYQFTAFFNQANELGMNSDDGNCGPTILLLPDNQKTELAKIKKQKNETLAALDAEAKQTNQDKAFIRQQNPTAITFVPPNHHFPLDKMGSTINQWKQTVKTADGKVKAKIEGQPTLIKGKINGAICLDNEYESFLLEDVGIFERHQPFSVGAWVKINESKGLKTILCNSGDKNSLWRGWDFLVDTSNELRFRLIHALPHDQIAIKTKEKIPYGQWQHVFATYDGSGSAAGLRIFLNGRQCQTQVLFDHLQRSIKPVSPLFEPDNRALRAGKWNESFSGEIAFLNGCFDDIRVYHRQLAAMEVASLAGLKTPPNQEQLAEYFLLNKNERYQALQKTLWKLIARETEINGNATEVQVMDDSRPRPTFVLERGVYSAPKEEVKPGAPEAILPFSDKLPANRLGLAQWLLSAQNPLTARVAVNRYWQILFGKGLVATPHDFGSQGALPSHPELLDWLALEFRQKWDIRALLKLMVTSATYRQSSLPREDLKDIDPENILLARGPSFRLGAEMLRDNALAAAGLLVHKTGGEPVKPYQPDNIWGEKSFFSAKYLTYKQDTGQNLYRRSMYTILKRTSPHPAMITLDGPDRSYCIVKRPSTNTPLQALVLLNDPTFIEAARVLAQRVQLARPKTEIGQQIRFAFRSLTGRTPLAPELELLKSLYEKETKILTQNPKKVKDLLTIGEAKCPPQLLTPETAALAIVNSTILNFDESYMRR